MPRKMHRKNLRHQNQKSQLNNLRRNLKNKERKIKNKKNQRILTQKVNPNKKKQ